LKEGRQREYFHKAKQTAGILECRIDDRTKRSCKEH